MNLWPTKPLGEVLEISRDRIQPAEHPETLFNYIGLESIEGHTGKLLAYEPTFGSEIKSTKNIFHPGEILYGKLRPYLNKVHLAASEGICSTDIYVLRPRSQQVIPSFAANYLRSTLVLNVVTSAMAGANLPRVSHEALLGIPIPVPPEPEQKRIVKLLDEADALRRLRSQADGRMAALLPALFHEMFASSDSRHWKEQTFGDEDVVKIIDGDRGVNYPNKTDFGASGDCLFLNTSNVRKGEFNFSKCDFITADKDRALRKGKLTRGDVILTTRGTLGNSAHFDESVPYEQVRVNSGMVILRVNTTKLLPEYLLSVLNTDGFVTQVSAMTSGSAQPQLPINRLSNIKFILPPLSVQTKFALQVSSFRNLEMIQATNGRRLEQLFQSIVYNVFSEAA